MAEQLLDLDEAWAELAAQEASELMNFRVCTARVFPEPKTRQQSGR